jgi:hypothetical protein
LSAGGRARPLHHGTLIARPALSPAQKKARRPGVIAMMHHHIQETQGNRSAARNLRTWRLLVLTAMAAVMLMIGAGSASASAPIEGIWSFSGGKVGIQAQGDGTLVGTVVAPTKFAQCYHPAGERMWTDMSLQPDGSYWGLHQWYIETDECVANPTLGLTAWRVLRTSSGARFLRVCFSEPGSSLQPTIAASGTSANATFGCVDSSLVASLPVVTTAQFDQYVTLPSNKTCFSRSKMRIRMRDPKNDPLAKVSVKLRSGKIHRTAKLKRNQGTVTATLSLKGLSGRSFTVAVRLTTVLGNHLSGKRTYRSCAAAKLRRPPRHHGHRAGRLHQ